MLLGAHMSIAGGTDKAIDRGLSIGCTAIQIFVKNNNQWFGKPIDKEEIERFLNKQEESNLFVFAHAGYLINLAAPNPDNYEKSIKSMLDELKRSEALKLPFIVLHPGSHVGQGEAEGIKKIIESLNFLCKETKDYKVKIALENTAGQGSGIGSKFEQLAEIINGAKNPERLGICFDTCHAFAAGYDIKSDEGYAKTWGEFEKAIGFDNLLAFHLNDSKKGLSSHLDRHEHIGKGALGTETFSKILKDGRFHSLPMVLETPKGPEMKEDIENLKILRSLSHPAGGA